MTIATALIFFMEALETQSQALKGVLLGLVVMMLGSSLMWFLRVAVLWKVERDEEEALERIPLLAEARAFEHCCVGAMMGCHCGASLEPGASPAGLGTY